MYRKSTGRPAVALTAVAVAQFMVALDLAVVNVALPAIRTELGFAPIDLAWVVHIYALTFGGFLLLGGKACDLFGRRKLFVAGLAAFGTASLAGGFAQEPWQLVAARAIQGLGAAAVAPAALATLTTTFAEGPARVRALGVWSAVNAAGGAMGVLVGGLLTEYASWRWVMLINVPIVVIALGAALAGVAADRVGERGRIDVAGAVLGTGGIGLLVVGVVRTDHQGWLSVPTAVTLGAGAVLLAGFLAVEARASTPLVRLGLFGNRWVTGANLFVFLAGAGQFSAFYLLSLYLQQVLNMSAGAAGAAFVPFSLSVIVGTVVATRVGARRSPKAALVVGGVLTTAGIGWFAFVSPDGSFIADVLGPSLLGGFGLGLCLAPVATAATTGVAPHEAGMASGVFNSARQLGGCVGVAALATIAAARTGDSTAPAVLNDGYALALGCAALLFGTATVAAAALLPTRRHQSATKGRTMTHAPIDLFHRAIHFDPDGHVAAGERRMSTGDGGWQLAAFHVETDADVHADHWEVHPGSDEAVCCLTGALRLYLRPERVGDGETMVRLTAGTAFVVPRNRWHRIELDEPSDVMSIGLRHDTRQEAVAAC
ncbi:MFS transporter [Nocardia gipuzkoensis]|uniref:MFS transporter n=1 Tax=Nocardia gipuzkoensis TaxID=2749991 RepID=UPI00237DBBFA|nr:MFS transporter [Nocardia gipuzkoensis]MDE1671835.1 MFS transporter [Nocardia gipuzkoensis]